MSNLVDIQSQIQKLQKQADEIKAKEYDKTVREILSKMQAFGISIKDLQAAATAGKSASRASSKKAGRKAAQPAKTVPAKYRGPNGETWSGRGLTPRWLSSLLVEGKNKEDFAVI
ncbi:MAG: H-NS histone family protein [Burkholderiaceae bacterium]